MFDKHPKSKSIYDYFQRRYKLGVIGLWHFVGISSIMLNEKTALSSLIIAPAGSFKSSVQKLVKDIDRGKNTYMLPNQLTDRSIIFSFEKHKMNNKLWLIEDAITCFPSLEDTRQVRLISLLVNFLSDNTYSIADAFNLTNTSSRSSKDGKIEGKAGLYVNIADDNFHAIYQILSETTFMERVLPFRYALPYSDEYDVNKKFRYEKKREGIESFPKLKMHKSKVLLPFSEEMEKEISFIVSSVSHRTDLSESRSSNHVVLALKSIANLEGRSEVIMEDVIFFKTMFLNHISLKSIVEPIEEAVILMLTKNRHANLSDLYQFIESDTFKREYTGQRLEMESYTIDQQKMAYSRAVKFIQSQEQKEQIISKYLNQGVFNGQQ